MDRKSPMKNNLSAKSLLCSACSNRVKPRVSSKDPLRFLFSKRPPTDLIPITQMELLVSKKKRTLMAWVNKGCFPAPHMQKNRILGWRRDDYEDWLKQTNLI
jgi:predicted DNA-binding transcriptional regulator AlpA